jgi:hypothetical protein
LMSATMPSSCATACAGAFQAAVFGLGVHHACPSRICLGLCLGDTPTQMVVLVVQHHGPLRDAGPEVHIRTGRRRNGGVVAVGVSRSVAFGIGGCEPTPP